MINHTTPWKCCIVWGVYCALNASKQSMENIQENLKGTLGNEKKLHKKMTQVWFTTVVLLFSYFYINIYNWSVLNLISALENKNKQKNTNHQLFIFILILSLSLGSFMKQLSCFAKSGYYFILFADCSVKQLSEWNVLGKALKIQKVNDFVFHVFKNANQLCCYQKYSHYFLSVFEKISFF